MTDSASGDGAIDILPTYERNRRALQASKRDLVESARREAEQERAPERAPCADAQATERALRAISVHDFLGMELPPREMALEPWLPTQGLAMLYAKRGIGKTFFALSAAYAIASGGRFLGWQAPKARNVLYIDGEMPAPALQERLASIAKGADLEPAPRALRILTPDLQEFGMPDLGSREGQEAIEPLLEGVEVVFVDNLSTLCRSGKENEAESWLPVQEWALGLRRRGLSVVFVHHAGKGGQQRGTSRREDVLDAVLCLQHPSDYQADQGARFEVHFEKYRAIYGRNVKPLEARLETDEDGQAIWTTRDLDNCLTERVAELLNEGCSHKDIADELGVSKSTVNRHKGKAQERGLLRQGGA